MMVRDGAAGAGSGGRVPPSVIGISRRERRDADRGRAALEFGADADAALDLLDLLELAWHDSHGDVTPPAQVVDDVWVVADGNLGRWRRPRGSPSSTGGTCASQRTRCGPLTRSVPDRVPGRR